MFQGLPSMSCGAHVLSRQHVCPVTGVLSKESNWLQAFCLVALTSKIPPDTSMGTHDKAHETWCRAENDLEIQAPWYISVQQQLYCMCPKVQQYGVVHHVTLLPAPQAFHLHWMSLCKILPACILMHCGCMTANWRGMGSCSCADAQTWAMS